MAALLMAMGMPSFTSGDRYSILGWRKSSSDTSKPISCRLRHKKTTQQTKEKP